MTSGKRRAFLLMMTITALVFASVIELYSDSVTATIEYKYDEVGNITEKKVTYTTTPGQNGEWVSFPGSTPSAPAIA